MRDLLCATTCVWLSTGRAYKGVGCMRDYMRATALVVLFVFTPY